LSATPSAAASAATNRKGEDSPNVSASTPPIAGPAIMPTAALVATAPSRGEPASRCAADIQATPVVHTMPYASPKAKRPTIRSEYEGAAWASAAADIRAVAAIVARPAPRRSANAPAGTETASVARPGAASSRASAEGDRPYVWPSRGRSGTIALCAAAAMKNRACSSGVTAGEFVRRLLVSIAH